MIWPVLVSTGWLAGWLTGLLADTDRLSSPRPSHAYGPEFAWTNGSVTKFASRERPQVVLDAATGWPTHLSNGVITTGWSGRSFTVVAPIKNSASSTVEGDKSD